MRTIALPPELEMGIAEALRGVPSSQWQAAARRLSERYRDTTRIGTPEASARTTRAPLGRPEALGYAGLVLPAAYAQLWGAMNAAAERAPSYSPETLLDIGSGPGTAMWAAARVWPSLRRSTAYEREAAYITLGKELAAKSGSAGVRDTQWSQITLAGALPAHTPDFDLIVIGHVLNELDEPTRRALVASAWSHLTERGVLLIVEPGTSSAFPIVRAARDMLLEAGAHTLAPCAHDKPCPLLGDWCHFPQRLQRPDFQRRAKEGTAGWEEAKFAYAAMARFTQDSPVWGRLIHQPQVGKAGVELIVSSREGIVRQRIAKRDREAYRAAADLRWGDTVGEIGG